MRVLLVQAISTHDGGELVFPLGLARLAAVIGRQHEVRGLDLNLSPFPWPELVSTLEAFRPQVVGISFRNLDPLAGNLLSFVPHLQTLAIIVARHAPEATLVLGGSGFTLFAGRLLDEVPEVQLAVAGEAEAVFPQLLDHLDAPGKVPGVYWRGGDGRAAPKQGIVHCQQLDALPLPAWQVFEPRLYQEQNRYVAFMGVETKRGCPNRCRYCLYPVLQGHGLRLRTPARVVAELEILQRDYGIQSVHFTDAVVNQPASHLRAICREMGRRRLQMGWTGFFREDTLTAADLALYQESGLLTLYFSADGASDHSLRLLGKDLTREQVLEAARLAAASGVLTVYHFLVNLPGETRSSIEEQRELLEQLFSLHAARGNLGAVVLNNLRLYPGTPLTAEILTNRLIDPRQDLLYPTYFNPPPWDHLRHELTALAMSRGAVNYLENLGIQAKGKETHAHHPA
jgi:putative variant cofactor biosynthesis B12-binding/radical SAM domain protein 1